MTQHRHHFIKKTILCAVLAIAGKQSGIAQTQELTSNQQSGDQNQSAAELGKKASNPLSSSWLLQTQQNTNWVAMPLEMGNRVQRNLLFQPLMNFKMTDDWTLFVRPVMTLFNSTPFVNSSRDKERATAFGDTVLAFAASPRPFLNGHLTVAAGPTFIFPTATDHLLGQHDWQLGPDVGIVWSGKHFLAYAFPQQWFKIGGGGAKTSQLSTNWDFTYFLNGGWSLGTSPNFLVDWQAPRDQRVTFPIGPQIGKLCKCGGRPTQIQLMLEYYPIHQTIEGPKWGVQLQITPIISPLVKGKMF